jgi:hypothetical protein
MTAEMLGGNVTWAVVALAIVTNLAAIIGAVGTLLNRKQLKTGDAAAGKPLGQVLTDVQQQLVTGNNKTVGEMVTESHGALSQEATPFRTHDDPPKKG